MLLRRIAAAVVGGLLLIGICVEGFFQSFGFYREHYIWPREKYGVLDPLRWQDITFLIVFWVVAAGLLYVCYRIFKYALHTRDRSSA